MKNRQNDEINYITKVGNNNDQTEHLDCESYLYYTIWRQRTKFFIARVVTNGIILQKTGQKLISSVFLS